MKVNSECAFLPIILINHMSINLHNDNSAFVMLFNVTLSDNFCSHPAHIYPVRFYLPCRDDVTGIMR